MVIGFHSPGTDTNRPEILERRTVMDQQTIHEMSQHTAAAIRLPFWFKQKLERRIQDALDAYWQDKIAAVWSVDDVILAAQQKGRPITRVDALNILHHIFHQLGREPGISISTLQIAIEEYSDFDICDYAEGGDRAAEADQVLGAFRVFLRGDTRRTDFDRRGPWDFIASGNFVPALASAENLACRYPRREVVLASLDYAGEEIAQLILQGDEVETISCETGSELAACSTSLEDVGNVIRLSWQEWFEGFKPIRNPLSAGDQSPFDGYMFETAGQDWAEVLRASGENPDTIWTVTEEGGQIWIAQGLHIANRLGHLLTECPWQPGVEYIVDEHGMPDNEGDQDGDLTAREPKDEDGWLEAAYEERFQLDV
jgi:hypothetical protein